MLESESQFWHKQEIAPSRPLETAISKLDPMETADFTRGCLDIYNAAVLVNPDVIFFPERGAAPFRWALEFLEQREGRDFYMVPLMIGTETEVVSNESHGQIKPDKRKNINRGVEIAHSYLGSIQRPMLIDEVQFGGTIRLASQYLINSLRESGFDKPLYLVAVQNAPNEGQRKMATGYRTLISNTRPGIRAGVVDTKLIAMDNQIYLNHMLVDYPSSKEGKRPLPMLMHNLEAERMIKNLTLAYINPDALLETLISIGEGTSPEEKGDALELYRWISDFLITLNENSWVTREYSLEWFWDFYKSCTKKDPSNMTVLVR